MLTNIKVESLGYNFGRVLNLNPNSSDGYVIRQLEGLTPPKSIFSTITSGYMPGSKITNKKSDVRQIVLTLAPRESMGSVFDLRYRLYDHFTPGNPVRVTVEYDDKVNRYVDGIVETHESNIFSDEPLSQISIYCEDPYFKSVEENVIRSELHVTTENNRRVMEVDLEGDADTSFTLQIPIGDYIPSTTRVDNYNLYIVSPLGGDLYARPFSIFGMGATFGLRTNDHLNISSHIGSKYAYVRRGDVSTSLLPFLTSSYMWPVLKPGKNYLAMNVQLIGSGEQIGRPVISYRTKYLGA